MKNARLIGFLAILLLSFAFGAAGLNADSLFVDEYWSLRNSGAIFGPLDFAGIWERTAHLDPGGMGVFYYWLLRIWENFIGNSPFAIRSFSLMAGLLAVAMVYRLGQKLFSARIGFYAALITASSAFFMDYLHEGRAYSLLVFLSAFAVYSYFDLLEKKAASPFSYAPLTLGLAALAYSHYVSLAIGAVLGLIHLLNFRNQRHWYAIVFAMLLGGLLFLPWLNITLEVIGRGIEDTGRQSISMSSSQIIETLLHSFSNANLALFLVLAFYSLKQFHKKVLFIWIYFLLSLALVILVNSLVPFMVHIRYLIFVWPALALLMALGLEKLQRFATAILICWMALGFYQAWRGDFIKDLYGHIYRTPMAGLQLALDTLNERAEVGDMALFHIIQPEYEHLNYFPLDYYMLSPSLERLALAYDQFERMGQSTAGGDNDYLVDVQRVLDPVQAVWTLQNPQLPITQRTGVINYVLSTQFLECETVFERQDMVMALYIRPPRSGSLGSFGDGDLSLYEMGRGYQNETSWHGVFVWQSSDLPGDTYSVALHLYDENGNFIRQTDFPLPNERPFSCTGASLPLEGIERGTYQLRVIVYNWQSGERLLSGEGDALPVSSIQIP